MPPFCRARLLLASILLLPTACASVIGATAQKDVVTLRKLLSEGKDPNESVDGETPLGAAIAASNPDMDVIRTLVEAGANVNLPSKFWLEGSQVALTPLQIALVCAATEAGQYLLSKGADPLAYWGEGSDPAGANVLLLYALGKGNYCRGAICSDSPLMAAILNHVGDSQGAAGLIAFINAPTRRKGGFTPLAAAAWAGNLSAMRLLLDLGAEANAFSHGDPITKTWLYPEPHAIEWQPIHFAARHGNTDAVQLLIERGADPKSRTKTGRDLRKLAQIRQDEIADDAAWAEVKAASAREREQRREEANAEEAADWARIVGGSSAPSSSVNPVDDDTFQREMLAKASAPVEQQKPATNSKQGGSIRSASTTVDPSATPNTIASSDEQEAGGLAAGTVATVAPKLRPTSDNCVSSGERKTGTTEGEKPDQAEAERSARALASTNCLAAGGIEETGMKCERVTWGSADFSGPKPKRISKSAMRCTVSWRCREAGKVCPAARPEDVGATKQ